MTRHSTILFSIALLALSSPHAYADCGGLGPPLVWTFPANDEQGIAINASIFVLTNRGIPEALLLDDVLLTRLDETPYGFDPGVLEPDRLYTVDVVLGGDVDPSETFTFRTSPDPQAQAPVPPPTFETITTTQPYQLSEVCTEVLQANTCADSGEDTYFSPVLLDDVLAWVVDFGDPPLGQGAGHVLWPTPCNPPIFYTFSSFGPGRCMVVRAIGANGLISGPSSPVCIPEDNQDAGSGTINDDGGSDISQDAGESQPDAGPGAAGPNSCACSTSSKNTTTLGALSLVFIAMNSQRRARSRMKPST
jgi:hypothetical protein